MKKEIKFPLIFGSKVYYNMDEIPADIIQMLDEKLESGHEWNYSSQKWELSEYEYLNLENIQLISNNLSENPESDKTAQIVEKQAVLSTNEVGKVEIKNNFGNDSLHVVQNNPHKEKYNKKDGDFKDYKLILIVLQLVIIVLLIGYIIFGRE